MPAFRFRLDQKHFENGGFRQRCSYDNYVDFPARVFHKHKSEKMTGDCCVLKFLRRSVEGKHLMRFQSEPSVGVGGA